jgi:hypothetical protein
LILEAQPPTIPVFIAGLTNRLGEMLKRRVHGGEPIRVWFGPAFDYREFLQRPVVGRTHRVVAERVMNEIKGLAERDRTRGTLRDPVPMGRSGPG